MQRSFCSCLSVVTFKQFKFACDSIVAILAKLVQYCILHKRYVINCQSRRLSCATVVKQLSWLFTCNPDMARVITEAPSNPRGGRVVYLFFPSCQGENY